MDNRRKIILITLIASTVILVLLIAWWLFLRSKPAPTTTPITPSQSQQIIQQQTANLPPATSDRITEENSYPLGLKQLASFFAERFSSYSSDQPNKNLEDLKTLMTPKLQANLGDLKKAQASDLGPVYVGFDAKALSTELKKSDAGSALIVVNLQRSQYLNNTDNPKTFYQKLDLSFIKSGSNWLVDSIKWE